MIYGLPWFSLKKPVNKAFSKGTLKVYSNKVIAVQIKETAGKII